MKKWYVCDPRKNTKCKKHTCIHNKSSVNPVCYATSDIIFRKDGTPEYNHVREIPESLYRAKM